MSRLQKLIWGLTIQFATYRPLLCQIFSNPFTVLSHIMCGHDLTIDMLNHIHAFQAIASIPSPIKQLMILVHYWRSVKWMLK